MQVSKVEGIDDLDNLATPEILDVVRKESESYDCPRGFQLTHSPLRLRGGAKKKRKRIISDSSSDEEVEEPPAKKRKVPNNRENKAIS